MFLRFLTLSGLLCGLCGVYGLDCSDKSSIQRATEKCFSHLSLGLNVHPDQIQNAIQQDPEFACSNSKAFKKALRCAMRVAKGCMSSMGVSADILPDVHKMEQGLDYVCEHQHSIDMKCIQNSQEDLKSCAMAKALSQFTGNSNLDIKFITCKSFEITVECIHETLDSCGGRTEDVLAHYTQTYLTPPACEQRLASANVSYVFSTPAPLTMAEVVTVVPMLPKVTCYSQSSVQEAQRQCFEREGIHVELPNLDVHSGSAAKQSYIDAVLSNNKDMHVVCRDSARYQRALGCSMEVARQCMPAGYKDYLPSTRNMQRMLDDICDHVDEIDQKCVTSKASALFDCGYEKGLQNRARDPKTILCNAFRWSAGCVKHVLPSCGCKTTKIYARISVEYLNPPACDPIPESIPECHATSDRFISHGYGGAGQIASSFLALVSAAFFSMVFHY